MRDFTAKVISGLLSPAGGVADEDSALALSRLVRLRWLAVTGQTIAVLAGIRLFPIPLDIPLLAGCIGVSVCSNIATAVLLKWRGSAAGRAMSAALLVLDMLTLTVMLHAAGGSHNPFTTFYLLHVTVAAVLLSRLSAVLLSLLSLGCYVGLHLSDSEFCGPGGVIPARLHFIGMIVALVSTALFLAYFVGGLQRELKQAESDRKAAREMMYRHERFSGLATLAAGVAHELATPLATISLVCDDLLGRDVPRETMTGDLKLIFGEVKRCRAIIDRLAVDSDAGLPGTVDASTLGDALKEYLSPEDFARLDVRNDIGPLFEAPRATLLQALAVLIGNGCDADASGGRIVLRMYRESGDVVFAVRDSGTGMDAGTLGSAGSPFFSTKGEGCGMGLGLHIVRIFAERMHGSLRLESKPGEGTVATLRFPEVRS